MGLPQREIGAWLPGLYATTGSKNQFKFRSSKVSRARPSQQARPSLTRAAHLFCLLATAALSCAAPAAARVVPGFGEVSFPTSCRPSVQAGFETAIARLHAFDDPEDAFKAVAAADPHCAIAWWGAAMTVRGNPLAGAPGHDAFEAGQADIARALAAGPRTAHEAGLIRALAVYYRNPAEDHAVRTRAYEAAMRRLAAAYPGDVEIAAFHALPVLEAVDLTDTSLARQREAASLLEPLWAAHPRHPGLPHYLIHADDYPPLAARGLPAARTYAAIAPAGHHALHMPSHIYVMLGMWEDAIAANRTASSLYMGPGHDAAALDADDPHGFDFIAYAQLQLGQDDAVRAALADAPPSDERVLVQARFLLERGDWAGAAAILTEGLSPFQRITAEFIRALGLARTGQADAARAEVAALRALRGPVLREHGAYWAGLVDVYAEAAEAWTQYAAGDVPGALAAMGRAADADDARQKHILLENRLYPLRELYADLLEAAGQPQQALAAYRASMAVAPNRLNGLLGAVRAARALRQEDAARRYAAAAAALVAYAAPGRPTFAAVQSGP